MGSLDSGCELVKPGKGESTLQRVLAITGNEFCCDCSQSDPRWASINLGITLCIECSGIHRSLGVHNSKVRSLTLDSWEPELLKLMCKLGNCVINQIYEARREEMGGKKPQPGDPRQEIEAFIRAKYVEKRFVLKPTAQEQKEKIMTFRKLDKRIKGNMDFLPPRPPPPTPKLRTASSTSASFSGQEVRRDSLFCPDELDSLFSYFDTSSKLQSLRSKDSGIQNSADGSREMLASTPSSSSLSETELQESESPMSMNQADRPTVFSELTDSSAGSLLYWASCACSLADMVQALAHGADVNWINGEDSNRTPLIQAVQGGSLITCEFLLQNAASVDQQDVRGRGPLHHATILGHTGQVCLFLKRGAKQNTVDADNRSPLSIAVEAANADIVTLLRLAKMNEEMRESEGALGQSGQYPHPQSHTEQQYKKCIQEFITLQLQES